MKKLIWAAGAAAAVVLTGCQSLPPGAEPGPHGTMAFNVLLEASEPGARVEANGEFMGETPLNLKIFGDPDGTFHDFGSPYFVIRALPKTTNQFVQTRFFRTGQAFAGEDRIPQRIYFDMNQNTPVLPYPMPGPPVYYDPPGFYPSPYFYGPGYYGPGVRFHFGPRFHHHPHRRR
jgi:hypothetical protein